MNAFQLYRRYIGASLRAQMQYPGSFLMMAVGEFIVTFTEFVGVWALFRRFGQIRGWTFAEIALFYGTINISFAIADAISRGFDVFGPHFVKTGTSTACWCVHARRSFNYLAMSSGWPGSED